MAIVPNFSVAQPVGEPENVVLVDTSTGSDGAITQRRVYFRTSTGAFLVPSGTSTDYVQWVYSDATLTSNILTADAALDILVQWLDVNNVVLYTSDQIIGFTSYNEDFDYGLTQQLVANPRNIQDDDFFKTKSELRTFIDSGDQAIERASDIVGAQQCYSAATTLRTQSQYYFNINA